MKESREQSWKFSGFESVVKRLDEIVKQVGDGWPEPGSLGKYAEKHKPYEDSPNLKELRQQLKEIRESKLKNESWLEEYRPLRRGRRLFAIASGGALSLREHIHDDSVEFINWGSPYVGMAFDVNELNTKLEELDEQLAQEFTNDVGSKFVVTSEIVEGLIKLNPRPKEQYIPVSGVTIGNELPAHDTSFRERIIAPRENIEAPCIMSTEGDPVECYIVAQFHPLTTYDYDERGPRDVYPVDMGLYFKQGNPLKWSKDKENSFWEALSFACEQVTQKSAISSIEEYAPRFMVAGRYGPPFKAVEGNRSLQKAFPIISEWYAPQTPLSRAVGLALFALTDTKNPEGEQHATRQQIEQKIYSQTRGDHHIDILAEIYKLVTHRIPFYREDWVKIGRAYRKDKVLKSIAYLQDYGIKYVDTKTGKLIDPEYDPTVKHLRLPKPIKSRRKGYSGIDETIMAIEKDPRYKLSGYVWRWSSEVVDDLLMPIATDSKGNILRDSKGKPLRKGSHFLSVTHKAFSILEKYRKENKLYAQRLLDLIILNNNGGTDKRTGKRTTLEMSAPKVYALLELSNHKPNQQTKVVANAIQELKKDGILRSNSDEHPYQYKESRRPNPCYRWYRDVEWSPDGYILSEEEASAIIIEGEIIKPSLALGGVQSSLFGEPQISGEDIRQAREKAGLTLRQFTGRFGGCNHNQWARIERGEIAKRTGRPLEVPAGIKQDVYDFVRECGLNTNKEKSNTT